MKDILSEIVAHKREEINALKERMPVDKIYVNACYHPTASLRNARHNCGIQEAFAVKRLD